jgi:hypothetical protein
VACAEGESIVCRYFAVDIPRAASLVVRMEADTDHRVFIDFVSGAMPTPIAGLSPLVTRQAVARGSVKFGTGVYDARGEQVPLRLTVTIDE